MKNREIEETLIRAKRDAHKRVSEFCGDCCHFTYEDRWGEGFCWLYKQNIVDYNPACLMYAPNEKEANKNENS